MAKKIKFPLEMRDGAQARTLEELQEYFDIEKAMGYLIDGKLSTWLEDRYYMAEAEAIREIDAYASDAKEKLCAALGVELEVDTEVDINEIERRKERLVKLKQYTDDEAIWEKVDQVAFDQEELADLLDEDYQEIYLCASKFQVPYSLGNMTYHGIGDASVFVNATGEIDLEIQGISFENVKILNENIDSTSQLRGRIFRGIKQILPLLESESECLQEITLLFKDFIKYTKKADENSSDYAWCCLEFACLFAEMDDKMCGDCGERLDANEVSEFEKYADRLGDDGDIWNNLSSNQEFYNLFSELYEIANQRSYDKREENSLDADVLIAKLSRLNQYLKSAVASQSVEELLWNSKEEDFLNIRWYYKMIYVFNRDFVFPFERRDEIWKIEIESLQLLMKYLEIVFVEYPAVLKGMSGRISYNKSSLIECDIKYLTGHIMHDGGDEAGVKLMVEAVRERVDTFGNSDGLLRDTYSDVIVAGYNKETKSLHPGAEYRYYPGCIMGVHKTQTGRIYYIDAGYYDYLYWIEPDGTICQKPERIHWLLRMGDGANTTSARRYLFEVKEYSSYDEITAVDEYADWWYSAGAYRTYTNKNNWCNDGAKIITVYH